MRLRFALLGAGGVALSFLLIGQAPRARQSEELRLDAGAAAKPFPHFWEEIFGSGRAVLSLRESYRRDLRIVKASTSARYIRFHAILDDENGVYNEDSQGRPVYNWSYVDQIYDGLLDEKIRPFVELSFMPAKLAASNTPHAFWYKPLPSPPSDYGKWGELIHQFALHLVQRYGVEEVSTWYFEVWNEPNIDFWTGNPAQATYFELYDYAARAVKRASPRLRVGGPATAQAAWIPALISHAVERNIPLDFVSTHVYGNDSAQNVFGTEETIAQSDMVARAVRKVYDEVTASGKPHMPIIWSEYNATYFTDPQVTDSAFMGPWLANNIRLCDGRTASMAYWSFSDVFEEQGVPKSPFYGGYGLVAEGGIPKAALNAFALLHRLGQQRIQPDLSNALVTRKPDGSLAVAVWNYAPPGQPGSPRTIHLTTAGLHGTPAYSVEMVDPAHGSAWDVWRQIGRPVYPTREQYAQLRRASAATAHSNTPQFTLPAHALALVEIRPQ